MGDLEQWLKSKNLSSLYPSLKDEVDGVDDFKSLSNEAEVNEFVNDLSINKIRKKKLAKAILSLIDVQPGTEGKVEPKVQPKVEQKVEPKEEEEKVEEKEEQKEPERVIFPDGINVVPFERREYRVPALKPDQYAFKGGNGLVNAAVSIWTTVSNAVYSHGKNKNHKKNNKAKTTKKTRAPQKLFADKDHKIILICGKTGAGKSTLINSMMNYIYNVQYGDKFRLRLIEEQKKKGGDADSCTDHISSYRIKKPTGGKIDYDLTIIDTPGFGDCRGVTKDMQILEEFKYVFDKILNNIDGICFVVKSADNRLDAAQTYVFNNILNLWAKDVADNIFILMTFADGKRSNCIDALNKNQVLKTCKRRLKINNSAFTDDPMDKDFGSMDMFDKLFWDMGMTCFEKFFKELNEVKPKAIQKSKEVLRKRDNIQTKIYHISKNLDNTLMKQQSMNKTKRFIQSKRAEIDAGKEVVWYEKKTEWVTKASSNNLITTCMTHLRSCHPGCCVSDKRSCCMMNSDGYCTVCSCPWSDHQNKSYEYVQQSKQIRKSNWDKDVTLRNKHNNAKNSLSSSESMLRGIESDLKKIERDIQQKIAQCQTLRTELERIALRPQLSTVGDYIDQLIENENDSPHRDAEKIKMLKDLKKQEDLIVKLQQNVSAKDMRIF